MTCFDWNPAFDTGVPGIDYEHRRLIALLNEIHELIASGACAYKIAGTLADFHAQATAHFALEEKIMWDWNFPALPERRGAHSQWATMQLKDVLVHVDASERCRVMLELAAWLAQRHEAHLKGIYVTPSMEISPFLADQFSGERTWTRSTLKQHRKGRRQKRYSKNAVLARPTASGSRKEAMPTMS